MSLHHVLSMELRRPRAWQQRRSCTRTARVLLPPLPLPLPAAPPTHTQPSRPPIHQPGPSMHPSGRCSEVLKRLAMCETVRGCAPITLSARTTRRPLRELCRRGVARAVTGAPDRWLPSRVPVNALDIVCAAAAIVCVSIQLLD